jgi:chromate transporter
VIYLELFWTFFKIGLFTFGGGYAMIPMIQSVIANRGWLSIESIIDFIAVSESTPGPFSINIATFVGMKIAGIGGSVVTTAGVALPSAIIMMILCRFFTSFGENYYVSSVLKWLRFAVVGLIASATITIFSSVIFPEGHLDILAVGIFGVMLVLKFFFLKKAHPVVHLLIGAALGILVYGVWGA